MAQQTVRTYHLPCTADERLRLLAEVERDAAEVLATLGFPLREAHRQAWNSKTMPELRRCAEEWRNLAAARRASLPCRRLREEKPWA